MNEVAEKIEEQDTQQDLDFGEDKPVETKQQEDLNRKQRELNLERL